MTEMETIPQKLQTRDQEAFLDGDMHSSLTQL